MWMVLSIAALAAEPLCEPLRLRSLQESVEALDASLAEHGPLVDVADLERVRTAATCLQDPIEPALLGHLAWLEAEHALVRHRLHEAVPWVGLARSLGVRPPERLVVPPLPSAPPDEERALAGRVPLSTGRAGTVLMLDGEVLSEPTTGTGMPHLVQRFVRGEPTEGVWQTGARFPGTWLRPESDPPERPRRRADPAYWERWLLENPTSKWRDYAASKLDAIRFYEALAGGGAGLEAYLSRPGQSGPLARALLEPLELDAARLEGTRGALLGFLDAHPDGRFSGEAEQALDELDWRIANEQDTVAAYDTYLEVHPEGEHAGTARERLAERLSWWVERRRDQDALERLRAESPGAIPTARAEAELSGVKIQALRLTGTLDEAIALVARGLGLRLERLPDASPNDPPAGTGALHVRLGQLGEGWVARAELWLPGGRAPVAVWTEHGYDDRAVLEALAGGADELERWVGPGQ